MPTLFRYKGYRFYFFSHEGSEPAHVHVDKGDSSAKFWLEPLALARSAGFAAHELNEMMKLVRLHRIDFVEKWHGYFGAGR